MYQTESATYMASAPVPAKSSKGAGAAKPQGKGMLGMLLDKERASQGWSGLTNRNKAGSNARFLGTYNKAIPATQSKSKSHNPGPSQPTTAEKDLGLEAILAEASYPPPTDSTDPTSPPPRDPASNRGDEGLTTEESVKAPIRVPTMPVRSLLRDPFGRAPASYHTGSLKRTKKNLVFAKVSFVTNLHIRIYTIHTLLYSTMTTLTCMLFC